MNRLVVRLFGWDVLDVVVSVHTEVTSEDTTGCSPNIPFGYTLEGEDETAFHR